MGLLDKLFGPWNRDRFARMAMRRIKAAGETRPIVYDREEFSLKQPDDGMIAFMGNIYEEYTRAKGPDRERALRCFVRTWFVRDQKLPESFEDVQPDLLPIVRPRSYFELTNLRGLLQGGKQLSMPYQIVGEHLAVGMVYDRPESMQGISQTDLDRWGVTFYEAMEAAQHNLSGLQYAFGGLQGGNNHNHLWSILSGDSYGSSRLVLLDALRQLEVQGEPVAMVPGRDKLLLTGTEDEDGLRIMAQFAEEMLQEPRAMSGMALRLDGDDWLPWLPGRDHPCYKAFHKLWIEDRGGDYTQQADILNQLHEQAGEDIFVASFSALQDRADGEVVSYSVWTKDVLTLLPRTEKVAFVATLEGETILVDWERAVEVVGELMEPTDMYPERWRVADFPNQEQWARLRS